VADLADQLDRGTVRRFDIMAAIGTWYMDSDAAPMKPMVAVQTGFAFAGSQVMKVVDHYSRVLWPIAAAQVVAAGVLWERSCASHLDTLLVVQAVIVIVQKYSPMVALAALLVSLLALRSVVDFAPSGECGLWLVSGLVVLVLVPLPFLFSRIVFFVRLTVAYLTAVRDMQLSSAAIPTHSRLRVQPGLSGNSLSRSASMVSILRTPDMSPKTTRNQLREGGLSPDFGSGSSYRLLEAAASASPSAPALSTAPRREKLPPGEQV
jgi:hypothetical protein